MMRYLKVARQLLRNSASALFAYRTELALDVILGVGWSLFAIAIIEAIFLHTQNFNGWNKVDMVLLIFSFQLSTEIGGLLSANAQNLSEDIRLGRFDFVITKPIDSQFISVFGKPWLGGSVNLLSYEVPLLFLLIRNNDQLTLNWAYFILYLLLILVGNIIWLSLKTIGNTINFWWQRLDNISQLFYSTVEIGKYPATIFPKFIKMVFYTVLPVAFLGMVPAQTLLGKSSWPIALGAFMAAAGLLIISRLLWNKAIKNYSSASS